MKRFSLFLLLISLHSLRLYGESDEIYYYNKFVPYASIYNSLSAIENPAALALLKDKQLSLFYQESSALNSKFYGAILELNNFGIGVDYINAGSLEFLKYSFPIGFRAGDHMLMGLGFAIYDPVNPGSALALDWYAGAYFMPAKFLNISVVGQNLGQPSVENVPIPRRLNLGIGIRPFSDLIELYGDFSFIEHNRSLPDRYHISIKPLKGLRLFFGINEKRDMYGGASLDVTKLGFAFLGSYSDSEGKMDGKGFMFRLSKNNYEELMTISKQVIVVKLDRSVNDGLREDILGLKKKGRSLIDVLNTIRSASYDNSVAGILLYISDIDLSIGAADEIKRSLSAFRERGKKVIAFLEVGNDISYFIATSADKIVIDEGGSLYIKGFSSQGLYFKGLFDKLGVRFDVVAAGEYKTAFEPLILEKASDKRREQVQRLISSLKGVVDEAIINSRGIKRDSLEKIYNRALFSPLKAREEGLVDDISTFDELKDNIKRFFGREYALNVDYNPLARFSGQWQIPKRIAIIYLNGDIVYGKGFGDPSQFEAIGNLDITEMVQEVISDESIAGVIVRINSPGGSTIASQMIYENLKKIKEYKPLVVSVGSMAASGGYLSAIASDYIVADDLSIVGSIGVFFLKPDLTELLKKLGINYDAQRSNMSSDSDSLFRGLTEEELKSIKEYVDSFYQHFKEKVLKSRRIDISRISEIAEGRVFTGFEARSLGLIDEVGGYEVAEKKIRELANIPRDVSVEYVEYGRKSDLGARLLGDDSLWSNLSRYLIKGSKVTDFILYRYLEY